MKYLNIKVEKNDYKMNKMEKVDCDDNTLYTVT